MKFDLTEILGYNPGIMPTAPPPEPGTIISFEVDGLPPYKNVNFSLRNSQSPQRDSFRRLRHAATIAMQGRCWSSGAVGLSIIIRSPARLHRSLNDYAGGVMDTLDGSSGFTFTYLPIAFEDDCQVCLGRSMWLPSSVTNYTVMIGFLEERDEGALSAFDREFDRLAAPSRDQAEQGVALQSATRSELDLEGGYNPQPESKTRSR